MWAILARDIMRLAYFRITGVVGFMPTAVWVAHYVYVSHTLHCIWGCCCLYIWQGCRTACSTAGANASERYLHACCKKELNLTACSRQQAAVGRGRTADGRRGKANRLHHHACQWHTRCPALQQCLLCRAALAVAVAVAVAISIVVGRLHPTALRWS